MRKNTNQEIDMLNGPLAGKILMFSLPIMLSGILQLLFNAADVMVVGKWAGRLALAAVGSNGALVNLLTNLFMGLSVGTSVQVSTNYGAGRKEDVSKIVHTSVLLSIISGVLLLGIGLLFAKPLLAMMGTPKDVIDLSALYLRIYFLGMPVMLLYNFGSAILRAVGDTKRPLYYLAIAGVVNVFLNIIFVVFLEMSVAGVALATILSQAVSCILMVRCLMSADSCIRLELSKLKLHRDKMFKVIRIGLPAGLQGVVFSLSNVVIQSSVNSFGSVVMGGNTASSNIEGFVYVSMNAFSQATVTFTSQNFGAGRYSRINKILITCLGIVTVIGLSLSTAIIFFGPQILRLYSSDAVVISYAMRRMVVILSLYFTCGIMEVFVGSLRGLGYSVMPMIVSTIGACGLRIFWIFTVFAWNRSLENLYISYPISWIITAAAHFICFVVVRRKFPKEDLSKQKKPAEVV
ncbi:MATE family efflux transporter [Clostridiales bacterium COT073_COT-073]|nr:MATE family efflux transporter [Clostridiales bacterium COT073_COT-073]